MTEENNQLKKILNTAKLHNDQLQLALRDRAGTIGVIQEFLQTTNCKLQSDNEEKVRTQQKLSDLDTHYAEIKNYIGFVEREVEP